jgi:hypothetical protein
LSVKRTIAGALVLGVAWSVGCATSEHDPGVVNAAGSGGLGGTGGSSGFGGGTSGSGGTAASSGSGGASGGEASGGVGGLGGSGASAGVGGIGGASGSDAGVQEGGLPAGFDDCVTQQQIDSQSSGGAVIGFCPNPFAALLGCLACFEDAVQPGDVTCSPTCICAPLPPLCGSDAGVDADGGVDASDAALD